MTLSTRSGSAAAALLSLVLAGCGGQGTSAEAPSGYAEPGWMSEVRRQQEEHTVQVVQCLRNQGQDADEATGMVKIPIDEDTQEPLPGAQEAAREALETCFASVPPPEFETTSDLAEEYARALDVRDCLLDQGYDVPPAPSQDAWIEAVSADEDYWAPLPDVLDARRGAGAPLTPDETRTLLATCTPSAYGQVFVAE